MIDVSKLATIRGEFRRESRLRFTTDYRMNLAASFGVFGKERTDIRSAGGEHTSMIASWNFDVLIRVVGEFRKRTEFLILPF
jgi:hypothetical protein